MFSCQFSENRVSVRERNIKLLLETVTYIATTEIVTCIIAIETVMCIMHCRKKMWRKIWSFQKMWRKNQ